MIESSWSECYQDLASWCPQPQDEQPAPEKIIIEREPDYESMYFSGGLNPSLDDLKGTDDLTSCLLSDSANGNLLISELFPESGTANPSIRYSASLLVGTTPYSTQFKPSSRLLTTTEQPQQQSDMSATSRAKPSIKLDISAANANPPDIGNLNTPDLFNTINDEPNFNIISYMEDFGILQEASTSQNVENQPSSQIVKIDHDYVEPQRPTENLFSDVFAKGLPSGDAEDLKPFADVKEEPRSPVAAPSLLGKRERKVLTDEDFVYDDSPSDHSMEWSPGPSKKIKGKRKSGKEGPRVRTSSISDASSVTSGPDKYRELRDRNNEASRRSRMNRKQKEQDMQHQLSVEEKRNKQLSIKYSMVEQRVIKMRRIILNLALGKKTDEN